MLWTFALPRRIPVTLPAADGTISSIQPVALGAKRSASRSIWSAPRSRPARQPRHGPRTALCSDEARGLILAIEKVDVVVEHGAGRGRREVSDPAGPSHAGGRDQEFGVKQSVWLRWRCAMQPHWTDHGLSRDRCREAGVHHFVNAAARSVSGRAVRQRRATLSTAPFFVFSMPFHDARRSCSISRPDRTAEGSFLVASRAGKPSPSGRVDQTRQVLSRSRPPAAVPRIQPGEQRDIRSSARWARSVDMSDQAWR